MQLDQSCQIRILAQDGNNPISITTKLTYPQDMPIEFQDFSIKPTKLVKRIHLRMSVEDASSNYQKQQQMLHEFFNYFSAILWDAAIKGQQQNYQHAEERFQQNLKKLMPGSEDYIHFQQAYEIERKARLAAHQQQRQDIKNGLARKLHEAEQELNVRYAADQGFSIKVWTWPWDKSTDDYDCSGWKAFGCAFNFGWNLLTSGLQASVELGQIIGDAIATAAWGDKYASEVVAGTNKTIKEMVNEGLDGSQTFIANILTPRVPASLPPEPPVAAPTQEYGAYTYEPDPSGVASPPSQSVPWTQQKTVSKPEEIKQISTAQMLWETLRYLKTNQGKVEAFSVPILAKDIFVQFAQLQDFPLRIPGLDPNLFPDCQTKASTDPTQFYNMDAGPENVNKKCGIALNNIMFRFPELVQSQNNVVNFDGLITRLETLPEYIRDEEHIKKILQNIHTEKDNVSGQTRVLADLNEDMMMVMGFNAQKDGTVTSWLLELMEQYYPNYQQLISSEGISSIKSVIDDYVSNKNFVFVIDSPERCNQKKSQFFQAENGFGNNGFGSFWSQTSSDNFVMDGEYTFRLGFYFKNAIDGDTNILHDIVSVKSSVADFLQIAVTQQAERAKKNLHEYNYPLTMNEILYSDPNAAPDSFALQVKNSSANFFDLKIEKVGNPSCPPAYYAGCLNYRQATFKMNHLNYRTGMYRVATRYTTVKDPNAGNDKVDWDKDGVPEEPQLQGRNSNFDHMGEEFGYKFVALHPEYATFARLDDKPSYINMTTTFAQTGASGLNTVDGLESSAYYYSAEDDYNTSEPPILPIPEQIPLVGEDKSNAKTLKAIEQALQTARQKSADQMRMNKPIQNMLVDLAQSHFGASVAPQNYDAFNSMQFDTCSSRKYLHIGALVNLTNQDYLNNKVLFDKKLPIPMILSIKNKFNGSIVRSWPFRATIGSNTFFQVYWDGMSEQEINELARKKGSSQISFEQSTNAPLYTEGAYTIEVTKDDKATNPGLLLNLSDRTYGFDAQVLPPVILSTSTNADVSVTSGCENLDLSNTPDYLITSEAAGLLSKQMTDIQQILAPYLNIDLNNQVSRLAFVDESFKIVDDFHTASLDPNIEVNGKNVEEVLKHIDDLYFRANYTNQQLTRLQTLEGGLNSTSVEAKEIRAGIRKGVLENKTIVKRIALLAPNFLSKEAFVSFLEVTHIISLTSLAAQPPQDVNIQIQANKSFAVAALSGLGRLYNNLKTKPLPEDHNLLNGILLSDIKIKNTVFEAWARLYEFELKYHRNLILDVLSDVNTELQESYAMAAMARATTVTFFKELNKINQIIDPCLSYSSKLAIIKGEATTTPAVFEDSEGKGLKCRINNHPSEKNHFLITLSIRKALLLNDTSNTIVKNVGIPASKLRPKTIAFSEVVQNGQTYLLVAFSGEDFSSLINNPLLDQAQYELELKRRIREKIIENGALNPFLFTEENFADRIILAKESKNQKLESYIDYFPTLKPIAGNIVKNDAEIKILETAAREFKALPLDEITIYSDRLTCEYCQEVVFRSNLLQQGKYYSKEDQKIKNIKSFGFPLYLYIGESLDEKIIDTALNYLREN